MCRRDPGVLTAATAAGSVLPPPAPHFGAEANPHSRSLDDGFQNCGEPTRVLRSNCLGDGARGRLPTFCASNPVPFSPMAGFSASPCAEQPDTSPHPRHDSASWPSTSVGPASPRHVGSRRRNPRHRGSSAPPSPKPSTLPSTSDAPLSPTITSAMRNRKTTLRKKFRRRYSQRIRSVPTLSALRKSRRSRREIGRHRVPGGAAFLTRRS
jgi:hypothetical protein